MLYVQYEMCVSGAGRKWNSTFSRKEINYVAQSYLVCFMTIIIGSLARVTSQLKVGSFLVQSGLVSPPYFLPLLRHAGGPHLICLHMRRETLLLSLDCL